MVDSATSNTTPPTARVATGSRIATMLLSWAFHLFLVHLRQIGHSLPQGIALLEVTSIGV